MKKVLAIIKKYSIIVCILWVQLSWLERNLAKVEVVGSSPITHSKMSPCFYRGFFFFQRVGEIPGWYCIVWYGVVWPAFTGCQSFFQYVRKKWQKEANSGIFLHKNAFYLHKPFSEYKESVRLEYCLAGLAGLKVYPVITYGF